MTQGTTIQVSEHADGSTQIDGVSAGLSGKPDEIADVRRIGDGRGRGEPAGSSREAEFHRFIERHTREIGRLAYLMVGDRDAADDLTGDALLVAWRQWDTVRKSDYPVAYLRQVVLNLAATRVRRLMSERRRQVLFHTDALDVVTSTDTAAVVDVQSALLRLPAGRRACVVLRYAFDLPEQEVAALLGVSVGTVKSQTAKGADQLRQALKSSHTSGDNPFAVPSARGGKPDGKA